MGEFYVIDAHVHTYKTPEIGLQAQAGNGRVGCCGTPEELLGIMEKAGISLAVQVNMTPARSMFEAAVAGMTPERREAEQAGVCEKISARVTRRNEWTCAMAREHSRLVAFPSVDPIMGSEAMVREWTDMVDRHGAKGLKLHPAEGRFFPGDRALWPVYEAAQGRGLPVISHGGQFDTDKEYTRPMNFAPVLSDFPQLTLVIAHLGHGYFQESVALSQKYANVFFDTSAVIHGAEGERPLSDTEAVDLVRALGVSRVMFGSDFPWYDPGRDLERFLGLAFTIGEKEAILAKNAQRILGL